MNFDDLESMIAEIKNNKGEDCLICQFPIMNKQDSLKLSCNHYYHKGCLKSSATTIVCPYCNKIDKVKINKITIKNKCSSVIKSGPNKGSFCSRVNCKFHKKINTKDMCKTILKTGKNKGLPCARINCKLHNKNIEL